MAASRRSLACVGRVTRELTGLCYASFSVQTEMKQGAIVIRVLFCVHGVGLLESFDDLGAGCHIGDISIGTLAMVVSFLPHG